MNAQNSTPPWTVGQIPAGSKATGVRDITPTGTILTRPQPGAA